MWTLILLFGFGTGNSPAQIIPLTIHGTEASCVAASKVVGKAIATANQHSFSQVYDNPSLVCVQQ